MDTLLSTAWLDDNDAIPLVDEASVAVVRQRVREEGRALGLSEVVIGRLVNVASELGHNQLAHAWGGRIGLRKLQREGVLGLEIIAADEGGGIAAPAEALSGGPRAPESSDPSAKKSLGIGLSAVLELSDETDFDVRIGAGTCVWARAFAEPVARRREVGIYGRPYPGEHVSGDEARFVRSDHGLWLAVADGLGHGPDAREASLAAIRMLDEEQSLSFEQLFTRCHENLRGTRGAVMTSARIAWPSGELELAGVGNVSAHVYGPTVARRFAGSSFVLGSPGAMRRVTAERLALGVRDVLVLFSDGLTTRVDLESEYDLLREHPIVIAQRLVERFGRDNDDAMVLVAR